MVKVGVITGSSASGLACMQKLLSNTITTGHTTLVRGCFRRQGMAATTRSSLPLTTTSVKYDSFAYVDAADMDSLRRALEGMDRAMLVTPLDHKQGMKDDAQKSINMIQAAQEVGVKRIVHVGSWTVNAPDELPILSSRFTPTEEYLKSSACADLEWTVLRGGYFMPNFAHVHKHSIRDQQQLLEVPDCHIPPVDVRDIGEAAGALLGGDHDEEYLANYNHAFIECCGPELLCHKEIAAQLSDGLNMEKPIEYKPPNIGKLSEWQSDNPILSELYHYMAQGDGAQLPFEPEPFAKLVGRPLTTLEQWAAENHYAFAYNS